jgi:dihydroneopterin aldolase
MSDLIRITDLEVWTRLGVPDEERVQPQLLLVSLAMLVEGLNLAAEEDDLALTVDYAQVAAHLKNFAATGPRRLLETFAAELAEEVLASFPVREVRVEVKKFVLPDARHVSVEIERKRDDY